MQSAQTKTSGGEDLSAIDGFEASVASYLADIRENGAYEVMKKLVK